MLILLNTYASCTFIFLMETMISYLVNIFLVPSLQLRISLSMDYLAHLNHHEPKNFVGCKC